MRVVGGPRRLSLPPPRWKARGSIHSFGRNHLVTTERLTSGLELKRDALLARLAGYGRVAVAFSGGVDSAVVAKAAALACGDRAVAVTAVSDSLASGELDEAREVALQIGISHLVVGTREFENPDYLRNASNRCYFCKTELYTRLETMLPKLECDVIVNGANLDDRGDHRPGMQAANEHAVRSPLIEAGLNKADVRALARLWDIPVWDKPATPCLSSRLAYGLAVTPERVRRVDEAERFLRETLDLRELRVRHEQNDLARIEVPVAALPRLADAETRAAVSRKLRELGFRYITLDLDGFRSGSMNESLPLVQLGGK
ncbi:MAG: ATP-dependent sacrificial sulfur transferase LarE [Planctomycetaceae bacterium]|nr:ATP-dependent sacrificial sulfur transferase LarE [Planctomycetaceae bacterium]